MSGPVHAPEAGTQICGTAAALQTLGVQAPGAVPMSRCRRELCTAAAEHTALRET
ncbi:hypothetical protein ACWDA7_21555 [Streptomyces sp. NPDC001156]